VSCLKLFYSKVISSFLYLRRLFLYISLGATVVLLAGCGKSTLYSELEEKEANQVMAILLRNGIDCDKEAGAEKRFIVRVETGHFSEAVEILNDYGYPKDQFEGIGDIFKKSGLVSSPTEERIRYMHGLSQDLQETLTQISGVLTARVHVVIPNNDPLAEHLFPSSAAVFIKYRKDSGIENTIPQIKNLIVKSIEGMSYDNVSVALFPIQDSDITNLEARQLIQKYSARSLLQDMHVLYSIVAALLIVSAYLAYQQIKAKRALKLKLDEEAAEALDEESNEEK
jgi:type III secretion protein J